METNLHTITAIPIAKMLASLSHILDKAAQHAASKATERRPAAYFESALLNDRLIFDQFSLTEQIQRACDNAKGGIGRIAGIEPPKHEDTEKTVEELKARMQKTIAFVEGVKPEQMVGLEGSKITLPYFPGKYLTASEYVHLYLLPNFYFHVTTAYAILRKNGVDIGKNDYIHDLPWKNL